MGEGKRDEIAGKIKETVGNLRGDDTQKDEGREEQAKGKMKQAGEKVSDAVDDVKDALRK